MRDGVVIAGGGLAAQRCCETLRSGGYEGRIRMLCGEHAQPYDRPPLSKELLAGDLPDAAVGLRPANWYADHDVELLLATPAESVDVIERKLQPSKGRPLRYERLLIATGAEPRMLPQLQGFDNVTVLRTLPDARRLRGAIHPGHRLVIVGAGLIGLEVGATARGLGADVTILEAAKAPLSAVVGGQLGSWFASLHSEGGVSLIMPAYLERVIGSHAAHALVLNDGRRIPCDHVLVAVGVDPATRWLAGSPLAGRDVTTDADGRTDAPDVYAAGDVARAFDPVLGCHTRADHWESAARQGAAAGRAMLGLDPRPRPPEGFWSDQYGVRIQCVGHPRLADRVTISGDPDAGDFEAEYTSNGATVASVLVGRQRALPEARRRVQAGLERLAGVAAAPARR